MFTVCWLLQKALFSRMPATWRSCQMEVCRCSWSFKKKFLKSSALNQPQPLTLSFWRQWSWMAMERRATWFLGPSRLEANHYTLISCICCSHCSHWFGDQIWIWFFVGSCWIRLRRHSCRTSLKSSWPSWPTRALATLAVPCARLLELPILCCGRTESVKLREHQETPESKNSGNSVLHWRVAEFQPTDSRAVWNHVLLSP